VTDPEPQIAASALLGLWPVQFQALGEHLDDVRSPEQLQDSVTAQVNRAARLIDTGLSSFGTPTTRTSARTDSTPRYVS
jgi:hypothetical protein